MIRSREATVADLQRVELQPLQQASDIRPLLPEDYTDEKLNVIRARALEYDGKVIACYGLTPCHPGVGEAWAFLSEEALKHPKDLTEDVLYWLEETPREFGLHRIQATAADDHKAAHRWLKRLGFEPEGKMRAFGMNREDFWMFGRVF